MLSPSSYQYGPDTYLLQVKDAGFPARLREYLGVARTTSAEFNDCKVGRLIVSHSRKLLTRLVFYKCVLVMHNNERSVLTFK